MTRQYCRIKSTVDSIARYVITMFGSAVVKELYAGNVLHA